VVHGHAASGFEPVRDRFEENFSELGEIGAAFSVVLDGETVVDLWAGAADRDAGTPWGHDTMQVIFSGTKGLTAACVLLLIEREQLDLGAPVARYWPEFAAAGKADITLAEIVSHRSGLPALRTPVTSVEALEERRMADLLAAQAPFTEVRGRICYHSITYGWLLGEIVRRVDGRTIGRFFADEIAGPLGLETWIGLPEDCYSRVGRLVFGEPPPETPTAPAEFAEVVAAAESLPMLTTDQQLWNTPLAWSAEIAAAGGITTARSLARFYGCLARGGEIDGVRILRPETVELGRTPLATETADPLWGLPSSFGVGFGLYCQELPGRPRVPDSFGHGGFGGSQHGAWPSARLGYSYVPNSLRLDPAALPDGILPGDRLQAALADCVGVGLS